MNRKTLLFAALPLLAMGGGLLGATAAAAATPSKAKGYAHIVTLGGPVTETVFALGAGSRVVAVDLSSTYPAAAAALPKVGYHRALAAEGILSLAPDLVLGTDDAGPPPVLAQIRAAKTPIVLVPVEHSVAGAKAKIIAIARTLGLESKGEELTRALDADIEKAKAVAAKAKSAPRVLFIYARGQGTLSVAGRGTAADAMIALAGGVNAVTGYEGYKPLTPEALAAAGPDIILLTKGGLESIGGKPGLLEQPGISLTPAGKEGSIVSLDDELLLGFGPRLGVGVLELARKLHPETR
jgi:iron complex transport system substrate-binding protein